MDLIAALVESTGLAADMHAANGGNRRVKPSFGTSRIAAMIWRLSFLSGARELIQELAGRGAALALVTGNLSAIGWRKMELGGLKHFFHCGGFSEDAPTRAEIAHVATTRARERNHAARECKISLIGDHRNDIQAARINGIRSIAVSTGPMPANELRHYAPDVLVESLVDLDPNLLFE